MKLLKKSLLFSISALMIFPVSAQESDSKSLDLKEFSVTLKTGVLHSRSDVRTTDFWGISAGDQTEHQLGVGIAGTYMINSGVGIMIEGKAGKLVGIADQGRSGQAAEDNLIKIENVFGPEDVYFETNILQGSINAYLNLSNILSGGSAFRALASKSYKERRFSLFGYGGVGWLRFDSQIKNLASGQDITDSRYLKGFTNETTELVLPYGFGAKYKLNKILDIGMEFNNQFIFSDKVDAWVTGNSNDSYNFLAASVTYKFGGDRNADHLEWISPVEVYARYIDGENAMELKDSDGDGVIDQMDSEKNSPIGAIVDSRGVTRDSDKDGCPDHEDPEPYSITSLPIKDCVNTVSFVDTDGDGIIDSMDKCPDQKGFPEYFGCIEWEFPVGDIVIEEKDLKDLELAGRKIRFQRGNARLSRNSFPVLDEVYSILEKYPQYKVRVEGHTDSDGSVAANQILSQNRAAFAMKYLVDKGLDSARMTAVGFGEVNPIADNKTAAGKAQNRRIEFKFYR